MKTSIQMKWQQLLFTEWHQNLLGPVNLILHMLAWGPTESFLPLICQQNCIFGCTEPGQEPPLGSQCENLGLSGGLREPLFLMSTSYWRKSLGSFKVRITLCSYRFYLGWYRKANVLKASFSCTAQKRAGQGGTHVGVGQWGTRKTLWDRGESVRAKDDAVGQMGPSLWWATILPSTRMGVGLLPLPEGIRYHCFSIKCTSDLVTKAGGKTQLNNKGQNYY